MIRRKFVLKKSSKQLIALVKKDSFVFYAYLYKELIRIEAISKKEKLKIIFDSDIFSKIPNLTKKLFIETILFPKLTIVKKDGQNFIYFTKKHQDLGRPKSRASSSSSLSRHSSTEKILNTNKSQENLLLKRQAYFNSTKYTVCFYQNSLGILIVVEDHSLSDDLKLQLETCLPANIPSHLLTKIVDDILSRLSVEKSTMSLKLN